jgi:hypothetical protein
MMLFLLDKMIISSIIKILERLPTFMVLPRLLKKAELSGCYKNIRITRALKTVIQGECESPNGLS